MAILGGTLAAGTHFTKAGARAMINTSPEPFSNIAASTTEEVMLGTGLWTAFNHPAIFLILLAVFLVISLALAVFLIRAIRRLVLQRRATAP